MANKQGPEGIDDDPSIWGAILTRTNTLIESTKDPQNKAQLVTIATAIAALLAAGAFTAPFD